MSALEEKEKHLNKLKTKVDTLLRNNHPASDKIEVRADSSITRTWEISDQQIAFISVGAFMIFFSLFFLFVYFSGLQRHSADAVELASSNYQVHWCSSEGECCVQPGNMTNINTAHINSLIFTINGMPVFNIHLKETYQGIISSNELFNIFIFSISYLYFCLFYDPQLHRFCSFLVLWGGAGVCWHSGANRG